MFLIHDLVNLFHSLAPPKGSMLNTPYTPQTMPQPRPAPQLQLNTGYAPGLQAVTPDTQIPVHAAPMPHMAMPMLKPMPMLPHPVPSTQAITPMQQAINGTLYLRNNFENKKPVVVQS